MARFFQAKRIEVFIIVAIIAAIGVVYAFTRKPVAAPTITGIVQNQTISYEGQDGRSALELLRVFHQVETKDTSFGPQIMGIDGNHPDESNSYWALYVNGKLSDKGADSYITQNGDKIEWKVEKF